MSFWGIVCKNGGGPTPFVPNADGSKLHISQVNTPDPYPWVPGAAAAGLWC